VQITIADKAGARVRQLETRAEANTVNRATWDLRGDAPVPPAGGRGGRGGAAGAPPPATTPTAEGGEAPAAPAGGGGGRGGFGAGRGPLVDPGEYKLTISANGKTESRTITVQDDPRVQFSNDDRAKKRKALDTLVTMTKDADAARRRAVAMNTALTSLTDGWKAPSAPTVPDNVKKSAEDLLARVKKVVARLEAPAGGRGGAGAPPPYTAPAVPTKLGRLMAAIDNYSAAPTSRQLAEIEEAAAQLKTATAEVNTLWDEVPKLNKQLTDAGVPHFTVNPNPPATGGRGGRGN
jgi:hypothetical protein